MIIAMMLLVLSQSPPFDAAGPEPVVCEQSERDPVTGSRLWCPAEVKGRVPQRLLATAPIDQVGKGWALLKCDLGENGVTTACRLVEESEPQSPFGAWATSVQLRAIAQGTDGNLPTPGDSYYAFARWEVR
ncbi:hypothetical protein U0030_09055 [Brevundimonas bullata]|uniref:hypothetical protein n=1 Tax=Brevundimonas bullata TaxID=13160 RepID=UPI0013B38769|nr:hypothetical protein [Brevundimonas bullata]WQE35451.1 hypothetical protein U0030_09055 [Brevundimonas bullata]